MSDSNFTKITVIELLVFLFVFCCCFLLSFEVYSTQKETYQFYYLSNFQRCKQQAIFISCPSAWSLNWFNWSLKSHNSCADHKNSVKSVHWQSVSLLQLTLFTRKLVEGCLTGHKVKDFKLLYAEKQHVCVSNSKIICSVKTVKLWLYHYQANGTASDLPCSGRKLTTQQHHCHTSAEQISASKSHCCMLHHSKTEKNMFWYCHELSVWARHMLYLNYEMQMPSHDRHVWWPHTVLSWVIFFKWPHADRRGGGNYLWQWYHFLTCLSTGTIEIEWHFFCSKFVT